MNELVEKLVENSVLSLVLLAGMYGIYWGVAWIGPNFLTPIKDQIIAHLSKLDLAIDAMMELMRGQTESVKKQNDVLTRMERTVEKTGLDTDDNTEVLKRIDTNVAELKKNASRFFHESHADHERGNVEHTKDTTNGNN